MKRYMLLALAAAVTCGLFVSGVVAAPVDGTGATYGVYGQCTATTAYGYLGYTRFGIYAWTPTTDGIALYGIASSTTGTTRGIYGRTASNAGTAVYAVATSTTGATRGVDAQCASEAAIGVYGYAYSATGSTKGIYGRVASTSGTAVYGQATAATGTTYGVYGKVTSSDGWAGYFEGGNGLYTSGFKMPFGHTTGYVLTCDANGVGTWQAATGGGVTDHGALTGLADDDHPQYHNDARGDARYWKLTGNAGTTPGTNFLGTTDNQALELHVNSTRALRIEPHATSPNLVGGHANNSVPVGAYGCTIAGGGITGEPNKATDPYCTVGGGVGNVAGDNDGDFSIDDADSATVAGGWGNAATNVLATICGGEENTASGDSSFIGGGEDNTASGQEATVGGGFNNTASAMGATVPGGYNNTAAGGYSFAAGRRAKANHQGAFVWGDSTDADFASTAADQFSARATGGVRLCVNTNGAGLRIEPHATSPNLVGGHAGNSVTAGAYGCTIGGGGITGDLNKATDPYCTVSGGVGNVAGDDDGDFSIDDADSATVAGGWGNAASNCCSTVCGGEENTASGDSSFVGGGCSNTASGACSVVAGGGGYDEGPPEVGLGNLASGNWSTVSGGQQNTASGTEATVAGGRENSASGEDAAIGGGSINAASGEDSTIAGGGDNIASNEDAAVGGGSANTASGLAATVPGGRDNTAAGNYSFAAGRRAKASNQGAFVWADSTDADYGSGAANQFRARSVGGVYFHTNAGATTGVYVVAGGGSWASVCDRNAKQGFVPVQPKVVLDKLVATPISTWSYKTETGVTHMSPMAQDLHAAFGLGDSDRTITTIDGLGISMAAIQGLYQLNQELREQVEQKDAKIQTLEQRLSAVESTLDALGGK